jgi:periplasmic protein TonB
MGYSWSRGVLARQSDPMFEKFVGSNVETRRQRPKMIAAISVAVHAGFLLGLLVHGFWQVDRLGMPKREISVAVAPALPPPPAAPEPSIVKPPPDRKVRVAPRDATQPVNAVVAEEEIEIVTEDPGAFGVQGGSPTGRSPFGVITTQPVVPVLRLEPPPAPELPRQPRTVPPTTIEAQRVAGEKFIQPDEATKLQMARDGRERVQAMVKMCLSAQGDVTSTRLGQSSGYDEYDALIMGTMQAWKYRPYLVDNQPAPVCTQVTFIYQQN